MEELLHGYKFPALDFGSAFAKLGFGRGDRGKAASKVAAPGFAQKLAGIIS
jgi:hypothetical protein